MGAAEAGLGAGGQEWYLMKHEMEQKNIKLKQLGSRVLSMLPP